MKRMLSLIVLVAVIAVPALSAAKKTTYITTNRRLNYVKLVEVDPSVAEERGMTHPTNIPEPKMREILKSLKLSRSHLFGDEVESREIYDERAINFLAPALSRAFRDAEANEEVQFSFVVKDPKFILRNDRLTMVTAWVSEGGLFLEFDKLYAKLTGDTDKRGNTSKIVSRARGLRVSLELSPGQSMAAVGSDVMQIDLHHDFAASEKTAATKARSTATAAETAATTQASTEAAAQAAVADADSVTHRLEELDTLRKRGLITTSEYKAKKKEILSDL